MWPQGEIFYPQARAGRVLARAPFASEGRTMTRTPPDNQKMAIRLLTRATENLVDSLRGMLGLAMTNDLFRQLERVREVLDEKPKKVKRRLRADD